MPLMSVRVSEAETVQDKVAVLPTKGLRQAELSCLAACSPRFALQMMFALLRKAT